MTTIRKGLGSIPLGLGPAGRGTVRTSPLDATAVGAWKLDARSMRYVLDGNGNPVAMDGTTQRVLLLCRAAEVKSQVVTPAFMQQQAQAYRTALAPLVAEGAISSLRVIVADNGGARIERSISYVNAGSAKPVTLVL